MPAAGDKLGSYELEALIGTGGFGSVWRASRPDGDPVALKLLHEELVDHQVGRGPNVSERFLAEARLLESLSHPGLVRIFEVIEERERRRVAYAMELLQGRDLGQCVDELDLPTVLEALAKTADTLGFLHEHEIVHRDVKPANIFITDPQLDGHHRHRVKLLDFGVAKVLGEEALLANTATGMFMGSVGSMPPEAFTRWDEGGEKVAAAMDQWSLGVAMFWCLSGRMPFEDPSMVGLIHKIESAPAAALTLHERFHHGDTPRALVKIVERCLEKRPADRYPDMAELARAIRSAARSTGDDNQTLFEGAPPLGFVDLKSAPTMLSADAPDPADTLAMPAVQDTLLDANVALPDLRPSQTARAPAPRVGTRRSVPPARVGSKERPARGARGREESDTPIAATHLPERAPREKLERSPRVEVRPVVAATRRPEPAPTQLGRGRRVGLTPAMIVVSVFVTLLLGFVLGWVAHASYVR